MKKDEFVRTELSSVTATEIAQLIISEASKNPQLVYAANKAWANIAMEASFHEENNPAGQPDEESAGIYFLTTVYGLNKQSLQDEPGNHQALMQIIQDLGIDTENFQLENDEDGLSTQNQIIVQIGRQLLASMDHGLDMHI